MVRPAALYLARFDEKIENSSGEAALDVFGEDGEAAQEKTETALLSDDIRQNIFEEARATLKGEFEAVSEAERVRSLERLNSERTKWSVEEGERLGERFREAIGEVVTNLETNLEKILEPFVIRAVREQMVSDLVARLRILLADRKTPAIQLSGPADLLEAVQARLNISDIATNVAETDEIDVKARVDATVIETRIQEWLEYLRSGD